MTCAVGMSIVGDRTNLSSSLNRSEQVLRASILRLGQPLGDPFSGCYLLCNAIIARYSAKWGRAHS